VTGDEAFWRSPWVWTVPVAATIGGVLLDTAFHWHWLQFVFQGAALVQLMAATFALSSSRRNHRESRQILSRLRKQLDELDQFQLTTLIEHGHVRKH
jgi:hypothetical protein